MMRPVFHTNVDSAKRLVAELNDQYYDGAPIIGDSIRVYKTKEREASLKVVSRRWVSGVLHVELNLEDMWFKKAEFEEGDAYTLFENWIKGR